MECQICDMKYEKNLVYENQQIRIFLAIEPSTSGHLQIFPKKHYAILEEVPDDLLKYLSLTANRLSMLLFEIMKVHGTNIIIQNGIPSGQTIPHFSIHVIPRRTDDGLKLEWDMKQANPESLDSMQRIIAEGMSEPVENELVRMQKEAESKREAEANNSNSQSQQEAKDKKTNYFVKSLERIP